VILVPESCAGAKAVSSYRDGILEIRLPKREQGPVEIPID
jgi:HSP20 family molecular chaperone IbpA